ncbi:Sialidase, partial [Pseudomassariella vexata]
GTYPRLALLSDNSILVGYTQISGNQRTISVIRSTDNGGSFSPWGTIATNTNGGDLDNVYLLEVSKGNILAVFRNHDKNASGAYTHYRITVCQSTDGGKTWAFISQAVESSIQGQGLWEPFLRIGNDGKVQLTYSGELSTDNQETFRVVSSDGGKGWSAAVNLRIHSTSEKLRDGMQGIARAKDAQDGRDALIMVFETTRRGPGLFSVEYAVSYDDGASWGNRDVVYAPSASTKNAGSPQIAQVGDKGLVVAFMTDEDTASPNWPSLASIKVVVSVGLNGGKIAWGGKATVQGATSAWPGL